MISHSRLRELVQYDPASGVFTCVKRYCNKVLVGQTVGGGGGFRYCRVSIEGKSYLVARLAWFYMTGCWPKHEVDHINCNKKDNRWSNLREATRLENCRNVPGRASIKGVRRRGRKWHARIMADHKELYLGSFLTPQAAVLARDIAAQKYHGAFANLIGRTP